MERKITIFSRSLVQIAGKGKGIWKCVEWSEMNERGILKPDIVSDFKLRSKCMFGVELRKKSIERV